MSRPTSTNPPKAASPALTAPSAAADQKEIASLSTARAGNGAAGVLALAARGASASGKNSNSNSQRARLVKLLICGDSGAGKSCLMLRYCDDSFSTSFIATIGLDFKVKPVMVDDRLVRVQIWDAAGQERFRAIMPAYFRGAHALLLCYDVTDEGSFRNVRNWAQHIEANAPDRVPCVLVANKIDLVGLRRITREDGEKLAADLGASYFETSAKDAVGVDAPFTHVIRQALVRADTAEAHANGQVDLRADAQRSGTQLPSCLDCRR